MDNAPPLRRFFVPPDQIQRRTAQLDSDQIHHLIHVLRIRPGETVEVFDGEGHCFAGLVESQEGGIRIVSLEATEPISESPIRIVLAMALCKGPSFDWILQKSTELGVHQIVPLQTHHSAVQLPESRWNTRLERWGRIVQEAARQSGRSVVPVVGHPLQFEVFVTMEEFRNAERLLYYEDSPNRWEGIVPGTSKSKWVVCVGPEGGWHPTEVECAQKAGFRIRGMGPRVLRTETAALTAVSILQFVAGDLGAMGK